MLPRWCFSSGKTFCSIAFLQCLIPAVRFPAFSVGLSVCLTFSMAAMSLGQT